MPKIIFATDAKKEFNEIGVKLKDTYGFDVLILHSKDEINKFIHKEVIDVLIVDLEMKNAEDIFLFRKTKSTENTNQPFVIIASEKTEDYIQSAAFDSGADGFLLKPLKPALVAARVKAMLKRKIRPHRIISSDQKSIIMDNEKHLVIIDSKKIALPKKEFKLLYLLYSNSEKIFTRTEIAKHIWGDTSVGEQNRRTIDVHLSNLRNKIGNKYIRTISGIGYIFNSF